eukprot:TRINITY_DN55150_c0_g1_i1.p1 TRINITY_DN55150_c0_g1~~TRINITY_DN55150_c0_g1_i1.p1  ORF type:complete len:306 (-),score=33.03 TRINITY_DN55150_c0_g1_i1:363-1280(-)
MTRTAKNVRFGETEVKECEAVMITVSWEGALHHTPGVGNADMAEFDADLFERKEKQRHLSKRAHGLLALGRAAEMRDSLMEYLSQDTSLRLPDVFDREWAPRRTRCSSVPPISGSARSGRLASTVRECRTPLKSHRVSETAWQDKPVASVDVCYSGSCAVGDKVGCDGDPSSLANERTEPPHAPSMCRTAGRPHLTERKLDSAKTANMENEFSSETKQRMYAAFQSYFGFQTPQGPSEVSAQTALKEKVPLSPVPPCLGMARPRPPPPHRNRTFWRDGSSHAPPGSVEDCEPDTGVHLDTHPPIR